MISSFAFVRGSWIGRSSSWWARLALLYWLLFTTLIMFNITVIEMRGARHPASHTGSSDTGIRLGAAL